MFRSIIRASLPLINATKFKTGNVRYMSNLIKTEDDEWYFRENDYYKVGLTENIIEEILYIEIEDEKVFNRGDNIGVVENVKAVGDIKAQFDCELLEINEELINDLDILNNDLENTDTGWIIKLKPTDSNHEKYLNEIRNSNNNENENNNNENSKNKKELDEKAKFNAWIDKYGEELLLL